MKVGIDYAGETVYCQRVAKVRIVTIQLIEITFYSNHSRIGNVYAMFTLVAFIWRPAIN